MLLFASCEFHEKKGIWILHRQEGLFQGPEGPEMDRRALQRPGGPTSNFLWIGHQRCSVILLKAPNQAAGLVRRFRGSQSIPGVTLQNHHHMVEQDIICILLNDFRARRALQWPGGPTSNLLRIGHQHCSVILLKAPNQAAGLVRRFRGSQSIPGVTLQNHHHMVE